MQPTIASARPILVCVVSISGAVDKFFATVSIQNITKHCSAYLSNYHRWKKTHRREYIEMAQLCLCSCHHLHMCHLTLDIHLTTHKRQVGWQSQWERERAVREGEGSGRERERQKKNGETPRERKSPLYQLVDHWTDGYILVRKLMMFMNNWLTSLSLACNL